MKEILELDLSQGNSWNKWTEEVLKLQEEWKTIGWVKKKENEEVKKANTASKVRIKR